jgi:predicted unusual protein kinase regulating ubiquinone biosynthesis (AarF/ABC1/UbiB family)
VFSLAKTSTRQREILEIVLSNGWDYMRGLLTGSKTDEPKLPPPAVLRKILVELGPFYVKFGQLLSTRPDLLSPEYIKALTALQAQVPAIPWEQIEPVIHQELALPLKEVFSHIDTIPIAAGSIAQIHRATLITGEELAMKVQRPGISSIVSNDIALIKGIAELVSLTEFGQNYDVINLAEEFTNAVRAELDFTQEASYTEQLRNNLAKSSWIDMQQIVFPKIYWEITTEKLLAMEWLDGKPILEAEITPLAKNVDVRERRQQLSTLLFRAFFQQFYLDGFFHADPHPGNIFYLKDDRIAIIDCGTIGRLDPRTQQLLTEMLLAVVDMDAARCAQLTLKLSDSTRASELARLEGDYDRMLRKYYNLNIAQLNFSEVFYEVLQLARANKIKLPRNLGLYAKSLANLEGVARTFNPDFNLLAEVKPLMSDLFRRQLVGSTPIPTFLRTILDLKSLSLQTPRQIESLLDRLSSETLQLNFNIREIDSLRRSVDDSANRLSFSILVGSLIMGAAIISSGVSTHELSLISNVLFAAASFLGLWLIISILRSGRLK